MTTSLRRWCRRLHYWFGIAIAVPFFIIAVTGCILGFGHELDEALWPQLFHASGPERVATAQQVLDTVRADSPLPIMSVQTPNSELAVWIVSQGNGKGPGMGIQQETFVDPQSGAILGKRSTYPTLVRFLHRLHDSLAIDDGGRTLEGYLGLMLVGMIVTGLLVWLPPPQGWRRSFLPRSGARGTRWLLDWHVAAFAWPFLLILLVTVTGVTMEFPQTTRSVLGLTQGGMGGMGGPVLPPEAPYAVDADQAIARAKELMPGHEVIGLVPAGHDRANWRVTFREENSLWRGRKQVMVDAREGMAHSHAPQSLSAFYVAEQHGLHGGADFGLTGRLIIFVSGLCQIFLAVSGLLVWLRRRRRSAFSN